MYSPTKWQQMERELIKPHSIKTLKFESRRLGGFMEVRVIFQEFLDKQSKRNLRL